ARRWGATFAPGSSARIANRPGVLPGRRIERNDRAGMGTVDDLRASQRQQVMVTALLSVFGFLSRADIALPSECFGLNIVTGDRRLDIDPGKARHGNSDATVGDHGGAFENRVTSERSRGRGDPLLQAAWFRWEQMKTDKKAVRVGILGSTIFAGC